MFDGLDFNSLIKTGSMAFGSGVEASLTEKSQWVAQSSPPKFKSHLEIVSFFSSSSFFKYNFRRKECVRLNVALK